MLHSIVCPGGGSDGFVYGIDAAEGMIEAAEESGQDGTITTTSSGLVFEVCDGHDLVAWLQKRDLVGKFDKVFR